jgi:hypothetical protein
MKKFTFILCFLFSFNVLANGLLEIEQGLDEYHYAITVEWDQKDKVFYEEKTQQFFNIVQASLNSGVTKQEIISLVERKTKDRASFEALKLKMNLLSSQAASASELAELLKINSSEFYQNGASWNGEVLGYVGIGVVFAALLGYAIWHEIKYQCVAWETYRDCDWETDSNGNRHYDCDNERRCTEYVEINPK